MERVTGIGGLFFRAPPGGSAAGYLWPPRAGPSTTEALAGLTLAQ